MSWFSSSKKKKKEGSSSKSGSQSSGSLSSSDKKKSKKQGGDIDLEALGLDPSLLADPVAGLYDDEDAAGDVDDADLAQINDPSFGKRVPRKHAAQKKGAPVDLNAVMSMAAEDPTLQVEFREEDMRDPALLADLASLNKPAAASAADASSSDDRVRLVQLTAQLNEQKESCLFFKQNGEMQEAQSFYKQMKETQAELTALQERMGLIVPKPTPTHSASSGSLSSTASSTGGPTGANSPDPSDSPDSPEAMGQGAMEEAEVARQVKQLKLKALEAKRAGDKARALGFLSEAKTLEARFIASRGAARASVSGASAAATAGTAAASVAVAAAKAIDAEEEHRIAQYEHLETLLAQQVNDCRQRALNAKQRGNKTEAVEWYRECKEYQAHLTRVGSAKAIRGAPLPDYHEEKTEKTEEITHRELAPFELLMEIIDITHLKPPKGYDQLSTYVQYEFPFPTSDPQKGHTSTIENTLKPVFNHEVKFRIERKKPFQRFLEKRKVLFKVMHARGFLRSDILVGKGEVVLPELLTQCEVQHAIPLLDGRRDSGGRLNVRFVMQTPLLQKEVRKTTFTKLVIDKYHPVQASAATVNESTPATAEPIASSSASTSASDTPVVQQASMPATAGTSATSTSTAPSSESAAQAADPPTSELDKLEEYTESVENLFSNNVIEAEMLRLQSLPQNDAVTLRLQQVEAKMQILIVQVQTGRLTMEGYTQEVQKKIAEEREAAKRLAAGGRKQAAMNALRRAKIMQAELEEEEEE